MKTPFTNVSATYELAVALGAVLGKDAPAQQADDDTHADIMKNTV
ncbi:hypothetical protein [Geobacillus subterraneus]